MSDNPVGPALSEQEWAAFPNSHGVAESHDGDEPLYFPTKHGIAAMNLHGQPFGFTHEDVATLRTAWGMCGAAIVGDMSVVVDSEANMMLLRTLADRISALLPPQEKP